MQACCGGRGGGGKAVRGDLREDWFKEASKPYRPGLGRTDECAPRGVEKRTANRYQGGLVVGMRARAEVVFVVSLLLS